VAESRFPALTVRNYRLLTYGQAVSYIGTWADRLAQDYLVLELTGSATALGTVIALQNLPQLLLGVWGGRLADRIAKHRLLMATQSVMAILALFLAIMTFAGLVDVYCLYAVALLGGLALAVYQPARLAYLGELVGKERLNSAVGIDAVIFHTGRCVGPAVGGMLIGTMGAGVAFLGNAISYAMVILALLLMDADSQGANLTRQRHGTFGQAWQRVKRQPEILATLALIGVIAVFGINFPIWLVTFSGQVFHLGAEYFGWFTALVAVGSIVGAFAAAFQRVSSIKIVVGTAFATGLLECVASLMPSPWAFAALLIPIGAFAACFNTMSNILIQSNVEPGSRGMISGLSMTIFMAGIVVGSPIAGFVSSHWSPRANLLLSGMFCAAMALSAGIWLLVRLRGSVAG
jgi:MFS family permease